MKHILLFSFLPPASVLERALSQFKATISAKELSVEEMLDQVHKIQPAAIVVVPRQKITADVIKALPDSVKIIATSSVGFEHLDISAAKERGILLSNTPEVLTECTADLGMMLLLNACRRGREYLSIMQDGWRKTYSQTDMLGLQVSGKTLGILGMGRIGRALADRARGFGMKIIYCNNKRLPPELEKDAVYFKNFHNMLPHCQIISLNAPSTPETNGIMDSKSFSLLPKNAVLVNVGRGNLVNEDALIKALQSGHLFAAGLDVFCHEPDYNLKLRDFPNVFLTPHMGSATVETRSAMGHRALDNVTAALEGQRPGDSLY
ncbi:2-hydroxyacid dehydrogenase [Bdellovibrio bacteriovorus]|uniref:D-glycerate dehydrogenase n=1 Tax=Bdellovibrio bacteriovorus TaxID=959 RepID=A0A1Z3N5K1_BDEBC|nr:D-glycerate dehydrogenase [Bdellovibrio bacteriovorus]ASD62677.1 D-glycerate dehydrogenase [Bdellovibrio bacteriovorus]